MNRMGLTPEDIAQAKAEGVAAGNGPISEPKVNPYLAVNGAEATSKNRFLARVWREAWSGVIQRRNSERKLARLNGEVVPRAAEAPGSQLPETSSVED